MQGVAIFRDNNNVPVIFMYKEINKNKILLVIYYNRNLKYNYVDCKMITKLIPSDAIHIITSLPYYNDINLTLRFWKIMIYNRLKNYNKV